MSPPPRASWTTTVSALPLFGLTTTSKDKPANILSASRALSPHLARSRALDRKLVAATMTMAFGATDAEGAWSWRDAYDASGSGSSH